MASCAKWNSTAVLDLALAGIAASNQMWVVAGVATAATPTYSECTTTSVNGTTGALTGAISMTIGAGNGDYTLSTPATTSRRLTMTAKATNAVTYTGTATGIALVTSGTTTINYMTTCTSQALTSGNTVSVPSWTITLAAAT